jgi:formylglycine-generating enzyme required for sulfatase activity
MTKRRYLFGGIGLIFLGLLLVLVIPPWRDAVLALFQDNSGPPLDPRDYPSLFANSLGMKFRLIPAGKFTMGSTKEEIDAALKLVEKGKRYDDPFTIEGPAHSVEITHPFYMGETEVTVGQFRQFVEDSKYNVGDDRWKKPGWNHIQVGQPVVFVEQTDNHPVVFVDWKNTNDFCLWLSKKEGKEYRLPTEAEWEYCCRAGTKTRYSFGDNEGELSRYAWISTNSQGNAHPVKELDPNPWGLYDMHGNVGEWCQDLYDMTPEDIAHLWERPWSVYYKASPRKDPPGPAAGLGRMVRGGSWYNAPVFCRSAFRGHTGPDARGHQIGFRVLLVLPAGGVRP